MEVLVDDTIESPKVETIDPPKEPSKTHSANVWIWGLIGIILIAALMAIANYLNNKKKEDGAN